MEPRHEIVRKKFNNASIADKCTIVDSFGKWLMSYRSMNYHIQVYHVSHKLIEVHYNDVTSAIEIVYMPSYKEMDYMIQEIYFDL